MAKGIEYYHTQDYKKFFSYFFELYVIAFTKGVATDEFEEKRNSIPPLNNDTDKEVATFLMECTSYLGEAYPPELLSVLMERQYLECIKESTSKEQQHMMNLAQQLIRGIHQFDIESLLLMSRLWDEDTRNCAESILYQKLPKDIQKKYLLVL